MIFSLNTILEPVAKKVIYGDKPVSYSWGDIDALHKWIEAMNKKQVNASLGIDGSRKYPLIWLVEGWKGEEKNPGIKFTNVSFHIAINSRIETLNEIRVEKFDTLYKVANDFIKELKKISRIEENNISYFQKANLNTVSTSNEKKSYTSDIWDVVIINMDLHIVNLNNCFS
jgi:RAB protein geranylgeranyltransferase component A